MAHNIQQHGVAKRESLRSSQERERSTHSDKRYLRLVRRSEVSGGCMLCESEVRGCEKPPNRTVYCFPASVETVALVQDPGWPCWVGVLASSQKKFSLDHNFMKPKVSVLHSIRHSFVTSNACESPRMDQGCHSPGRCLSLVSNTQAHM